jgi:hypothetical protein
MVMFAVTTAKGPAWDGSRGIRDQADFEPHAEFMDRLVARGAIVLGGPVESTDDADIALLAVEADSPDEVHRLFAADPWILNQVFRLKSVRAWTIWLDGRHRHDESRVP